MQPWGGGHSWGTVLLLCPESLPTPTPPLHARHCPPRPTEPLLGSTCVTLRLPLWKEVGPWEGAFPSLPGLRPPPGGQEAVQGCGRILSPTPGFPTSVPPSVLRKVLRESLPLLETLGRQRRRGPSSGESSVNQRLSPQREQSVSTERPRGALAHWGRTLSSILHTET